MRSHYPNPSFWFPGSAFGSLGMTATLARPASAPRRCESRREHADVGELLVAEHQLGAGR